MKLFSFSLLAEVPAGNPMSEFDYFMYFMASLFVIVLVFFSLRILARVAKGRGYSRYMKVIDRIVLSNDQSLLLVQVDDQVLLVGKTKTNITLLKTIEIDQIDVKPEPKGFEKVLREKVNKMRGKDVES